MSSPTLQKRVLTVLIAIATVLVVGLVLHDTLNPKPAPSIAEREAIEAREQAKDAQMDQLISQHRFAIGMTAAQVRRALFSQPRVNRTVFTNHLNEQWVCGDPLRGATYLYFEDGILTSFQDSR